MKRSITVVEAKSSALREQSDQGIELLDTVCGVLDRIKARMDRCPALLEFHPVRRVTSPSVAHHSGQNL